MPERVVRSKRTWVRIAAAFATVVVMVAAAASYHGLPALARLRGEIGLLKRNALGGVQVAEMRVEPPSAARDSGYVNSEREWLLQSQLPNGAIAQTPKQELVVPYFANLAAKIMVDIEPLRARLYITWYLENMNMPDRNGLSGTIYDYEMRDGELVPTNKYDSADSYAATFLSLVSYYFHNTGDSDFIESNLTSIDLAAEVILTLQDSDGLVRVMPGSRTKYLMDNSECYRGLLDWADVLEVLGKKRQADTYVGAASKVAKGIDDVLYDADREAYAWSLSWLGKRFPREGKWYPDAVSQTDLISCGVIDPASPKAMTIWSKFNEQFPSWDQGVNGDKFPWAKIALTATIMEDTSRAERFVTWVRSEFATSGRPYPWYVMESAGTLEAVGVILRKVP